jgi:hypothetical protein
MRAIHFWLMAGIALCVGCPPPAPPFCQVTERRFDRFLVPGEPVKLTVGFDEGCAHFGPEPTTTIHVADQVMVEVRNPDDEAVAFTVTAPMRTPGNFSFANTAEITFTPDRPGSYRVNAIFEPAIGRSQQVIEAVTPRPDAGVRVIPVTLPSDCQQYAVTDLGTVLCAYGVMNNSRIDEQSTLATHRGQSLEAVAVAMDQNVVWRLTTEGTLERLVDNGTSLEATHSRARMQVANSHAMAAGDGALWLASGQADQHPFFKAYLVAVRPAPDGGLDVEDKGLTEFVPGAVTVDEKAARIYGFTNTGNAPLVISFFPDGGSSRFPVTGNLAGPEGDTFWFITNFVNLTAVRQAGDAVLRSSVSLPKGIINLNSQRVLSPSTVIVPTAEPFRGGLAVNPPFAVPRFDGTSIVLETYDTGREYQSVSSATSRHAFARSIDGKSIKIFSR